MSDNTQELREKIRHYLISTQQDGAGIATGRRSTDGSLYKSRIDEFTEMIMSDIKSQTNQAVLEALDRVEKEVIGSDSYKLNDIYGNDPRNNYGSHETEVRDAANWMQRRLRQKLATLRQELTQETKK